MQGVLQGVITKKHASEVLQSLTKEMAEEEPDTCAEGSPKGENPLERQPGGSHYKDLKIQPIEYIHANRLGFLEGDIVKRITRLWMKGDRRHALQDLRKIQHECDLIIKLENLDD